jgi:NADH-quinone oxidoreductase subunit F
LYLEPIFHLSFTSVTIVAESVLFQNQQTGRPATLDEYRRSGGYHAIEKALKGLTPKQLAETVKAAGLRGRGGAGFPTGIKWSSVRGDAPHPRFILANADEMEPGTFKDRVLINTDPHMIIEGTILAGYAASADKGIIFIRPSYDREAEILEEAIRTASREGYLGKNVLGSEFSCELVVHRSGGRYICGESSGQVNAIQGNRPHPIRWGAHMTESGLWGLPTMVNNVETLACAPHIVRKGPEWFKNLAVSESGAGTKLYCVSGKVKRPGCYELPMGTRLIEILEGGSGGMSPGSEFKAFMPGGASTSLLPKRFTDLRMDFDPFKKAGHRLGTGAVIVFDHKTCLVGATLNLMEYFARESCGFCTPCREGLPYIRDLLWRIERGEGRDDFPAMLRQMVGHMDHAYCKFAAGAVEPLNGLLTYFEEELLEHISQGGCPFGTK